MAVNQADAQAAMDLEHLLSNSEQSDGPEQEGNARILALPSGLRVGRGAGFAAAGAGLFALALVLGVPAARHMSAVDAPRGGFMQLSGEDDGTAALPTCGEGTDNPDCTAALRTWGKPSVCRAHGNDQSPDGISSARIVTLDLESCKDKCATSDWCTGVEHRASEDRCELWTVDIGYHKHTTWPHVQPVDFECWKKVPESERTTPTPGTTTAAGTTAAGATTAAATTGAAGETTAAAGATTTAAAGATTTAAAGATTTAAAGATTTAAAGATTTAAAGATTAAAGETTAAGATTTAAAGATTAAATTAAAGATTTAAAGATTTAAAGTTTAAAAETTAAAGATTAAATTAAATTAAATTAAAGETTAAAATTTAAATTAAATTAAATTAAATTAPATTVAA